LFTLRIQNGAQGAMTAEARWMETARCASADRRIVVQAQKVFLDIIRLIHGCSSPHGWLDRMSIRCRPEFVGKEGRHPKEFTATAN
jgi:hypothetical protein